MNSVENLVSILDISSDVINEVVVPKEKDTNAKYVAKVLSKTCVIIRHCQFPRYSLKIDDIAIKFPKEEYKVSLESCKNHLYVRLILFKGHPPLKLQELCSKLNTIWNPLSK